MNSETIKEQADWLRFELESINCDPILTKALVTTLNDNGAKTSELITRIHYIKLVISAHINDGPQIPNTSTNQMR